MIILLDKKILLKLADKYVRVGTWSMILNREHVSNDTSYQFRTKVWLSPGISVITVREITLNTSMRKFVNVGGFLHRSINLNLKFL